MERATRVGRAVPAGGFGSAGRCRSGGDRLAVQTQLPGQRLVRPLPGPRPRHRPRVRRELHGQSVEERRQTQGGTVGVRAAELAGRHTLGDDSGDLRLPLPVQVPRDVAQRGLAQRHRPALDPQSPALGLPGRGVPPHRRPQPAQCRGAAAQQLAQVGEIVLGGVREGGGDELLLGGEVVEHQRVADAERGGHVGDPQRRHTPRRYLLQGRAQQLLAPLRHTQSDSPHARHPIQTPGAGAAAAAVSCAYGGPRLPGTPPLSRSSRRPCPCRCSPRCVRCVRCVRCRAPRTHP